MADRRDSRAGACVGAERIADKTLGGSGNATTPQQVSSPTYKPGSVGSRSSRTVIPLGAWSPAPSSSLPAASWSRWTASRCLFGLAPAGVYRAAPVTRCAVGSYPHLFTLTCSHETVGHRRCVFCGTFRRAARDTRNHAPRRYLAACPWSPDFPRGEPHCSLGLARDRPVGDVNDDERSIAG
jgi:hypothetical protein